MSHFVSRFKTLPKRSELLESAGVDLVELFSKPLPYESLDPKSYEYKYLDTVARILKEGHTKASRPGQYTLMLDDVQFSIDISGNSIPVLSSRFTSAATACKEMIWFLSGQTDVAELKANNVPVWDEWVDPKTAVFVPLEEGKDLLPTETLNFLRCLRVDVYNDFKKYQASKVIAKPTEQDIKDFIASEFNTTGFEWSEGLRARLVKGSIGYGGYGSQWRSWTDTRAVGQNSALKAQLISNGYKEIGELQNPRNYSVDSSFGRHIGLGSNQVLVKEYDQIKELVEQISKSPDSRRILVSAWSPSKVFECQLPWCHYSFQVITHVNEETGERELTLKLLLRSSDYLLGGVYNIAQYSFLAHLLAHLTGTKATKLVFSAGDCHIYEDQLPFVTTQLTNPVKPVKSVVRFNKETSSVDEITYGDFTFAGYSKADSAGVVNYPVAV